MPPGVREPKPGAREVPLSAGRRRRAKNKAQGDLAAAAGGGACWATAGREAMGERGPPFPGGRSCWRRPRGAEGERKSRGAARRFGTSRGAPEL